MALNEPVWEHDREPYYQEPEPVESGRWRSLVRDFIEVIAFALALYLIIQSLAQSVKVDGQSMQTMLQNQDLLVAVKLPYWFHRPDRGDIVIFHPPPPGNADTDYIKRVIGLPGETISDVAGTIYIDGHRLDEPYLGSQRTVGLGPVFNACRLPAGEYWVMGDHRGASSDSRFFGPVRGDTLEGRAVLRFYPLSSFSLLTQSSTLEPDVSDSATASPGAPFCRGGLGG
ncbi:MAG: signal peptidase I [Candidatus Dormibacteria bacterium]